MSVSHRSVYQNLLYFWLRPAYWTHSWLIGGEVFRACPSGPEREHVWEIPSLGWPGKTLGLPQWSWWKCLGRGISALIFLSGMLHSLNLWSVWIQTLWKKEENKKKNKKTFLQIKSLKWEIEICGVFSFCPKMKYFRCTQQLWQGKKVQKQSNLVCCVAIFVNVLLFCSLFVMDSFAEPFPCYMATLETLLHTYDESFLFCRFSSLKPT